jgi:hypothetical protein
MNDIENTVAFLVKRIAERPGVRHVHLLGADAATHARRRKALALAVARGLIVRSPKSPWTYCINEAVKAQIKETTPCAFA